VERFTILLVLKTKLSHQWAHQDKNRTSETTVFSISAQACLSAYQVSIPSIHAISIHDVKFPSPTRRILSIHNPAPLYAATAFSMPAKSALGFAPTISSTFWPSLKIKKVGMARIPSSWATSGTSSTSSLTKYALGNSSENLSKRKCQHMLYLWMGKMR
jgi:hypothetical protein